MPRNAVRIPTLLVAAACVLALRPLDASGSYRGRPRTGRIDAALYHLGKQVFTGEIDPKEAQSALLDAIDKAVPPADRGKNVDLKGLAGTLSAREAEALRFHVAVRYKLETLDSNRYERGGRILAGDLKGETQEKVDKEVQEAHQRRLLALYSRLPEGEKGRLDVPGLARSLTPEALDALEYHSAVRFQLPSVDQESYDLGAKLLQGERDQEQLDHLAAEKQFLAALESKLPQGRRPVSVTSLAGRLTPEQLEALEYYLHVRYRLK